MRTLLSFQLCYNIAYRLNYSKNQWPCRLLWEFV